MIFDYAGCGSTCATTAINLNGSSYLTFEGLGRWQINNLYNTSSARSAVGISDSGGTNITVDNMSFTSVNNPIRLNNGTAQTVSNNSFHYTRGDAAIEALERNGDPFGSTLIYGNYIELACQGAAGSGCTGGGPDGLHAGDGDSIYSNKFKEIFGNAGDVISTQHPDMIQNEGDNIKVYNNEFENVGDSNFDFDACTTGASIHDIWIYNNLFHVTQWIDNYPDFIRVYDSLCLSSPPISTITNFKVMNNLFADDFNGGGIPPVNICLPQYGSGGQGGCAATVSGSGNQFTNNIWANDGTGSSGNDMLYLRSGLAGWTADHNVYFFPTSRGTGYVNWLGTERTAASFVANVDTTGKTALPSFQSYTSCTATPCPATNDFHLQNGDTVAKDTGTDLSSYFTTDKDGTARPQNGAWDIGPYEFH